MPIRPAEKFGVRPPLEPARGPRSTVPPDVVAWLQRLQERPAVGAMRHRNCVYGNVLLRAIPAVAHGIWLLLIAEALPSSVTAAVPDTAPLTPRERDVLDWAGQGKADQPIAAILGISARTVQKHLERIYGKLGVESRLAAVMRARASVKVTDARRY